eukprot:12701-Heterococcus_DN1.PRE.3
MEVLWVAVRLRERRAPALRVIGIVGMSGWDASNSSSSIESLIAHTEDKTLSSDADVLLIQSIWQACHARGFLLATQ